MTGVKAGTDYLNIKEHSAHNEGDFKKVATEGKSFKWLSIQIAKKRGGKPESIERELRLIRNEEPTFLQKNKSAKKTD